MKRIGLQLIVLLIGLTATGQTPGWFNYQAVARDAQGSPLIEQEISVKIEIRTSSPEGSVLYEETHHAVTDPFGLFSLKIGQGETRGSFNQVSWGDGLSKWLSVHLDIHGGSDYVYMGSMEIGGVPHSLYAAKAAEAPPFLTVMTKQQRNEIDNPREGQMILNSSSGTINIYYDGTWHEVELKPSGTEEFACGDAWVDSRDGKSYPTVQMGTQCWMAKNLDIGVKINASVAQANNGTIEKYCYLNSDQNCELYGALYQWDELMNYSTTAGNQGICPDGWHIPTDEEYMTLEMFLGMPQNQAQQSNIWRGTDQGTRILLGGSSGLELALGGRTVSGMFTGIQEFAYLWTSNQSAGDPWRRCFQVDNPQIGRFNTWPKNYGMSVRCLKNQ